VATLISAVLFGAVAVLRILRLIRFFQLEEYQSGRFFKWIVRTHDEITFVTLCAVAVLLTAGSVAIAPWGAVGIAGLAALMLVARPRDKQINQVFKPTPAFARSP